MIPNFYGFYLLNSSSGKQAYQHDMDGKTSITAQDQGAGYYLAQLKTKDMGVLSYYVESEGQAVLIDPTFDIKAMTDLLQSRKGKLAAIMLTHHHSDFVSGHTQFKVSVVMGPNAKKPATKFPLEEVQDGHKFKVGHIALQAIHTPGHTSQSTCFLLSDSNGSEKALFSGDTLFVDDVGKQDIDASTGSETKDLHPQLFDSLQKLKALKDSVRVFPAHSTSSFAAKAIGAATHCTIGKQKEVNFGFQHKSKEDFLKAIGAAVKSPPLHFHIASINHAGSPSYHKVLETASKPLGVGEFKNASEKYMTVDTRKDDAPGGLIKGVYWLPSTLNVTGLLSKIAQPEVELIIFCHKGDFDLIAARIFRIGYFNIRGFNDFDIAEWPQPKNYPKLLRFDDLKKIGLYKSLDVRNPAEWSKTGVQVDSIQINFTELEKRVQEVAGLENIVVNCQTGNRARLGYSILQRHGIDSQVIYENIKDYEANGVKLVPWAGK